MSPRPRIVLGLGLDPGCPEAWAAACALARALEAELHVVHILEGVPVEDHDELAPGVRRLFGDLREAALREGTRVSPHLFVRPGSAAAGIIAVAEDVQAAMIVVGATRRRGLARDVLGSTATWVLQECDLQVCVVGRDGLAWPPRLLVALDPLAPQPGLLPFALDLARRARRRLAILGVVETSGEPAFEAGRELLEAELVRHGGAREDVDLWVRHGAPAEAIAEAAARGPFDLVVVGGKARALTRALRLDTISRLLRAHPLCSVLRVRGDAPPSA